MVKSPVKVHLVNGGTVVFRQGAFFNRDSVRGLGVRYTPTLADSTAAQMSIALDSVLGVETFKDKFNAGRTVVYSTLATTASLMGLVVAACIADPKCFGSCPTFYADSGDTVTLEAEGFSYSISPLLEARDIDRLRSQPDSSGTLRLQVWNEALETHYINHLELLESVHGADEHVVPDERGRPVAVGAYLTASSMRDRAGRDLRGTLARADGKLFMSADGTLADARLGDMEDYIDITVPRGTAGDSVAVVLRMRNSLLNTVLFYDYMLAAPGARSLDWMASDLERIGPTVELGRWYTSHLGLRVHVRDGETWRQVGRVSDYGPIAWKDAGIVIPAPRGDSLHIRLSFLTDQWRIDRMTVAAHVRRPTTRTIPVATVLGATGDADAAAMRSVAGADERYLITNPRDRFTIAFRTGTGPRDSLRTFLLASQGYYTEWVRGAWLKGLRETSSFKPSDATLLAALKSWGSQKDSMEKQFYLSRIPVQ